MKIKKEKKDPSLSFSNSTQQQQMAMEGWLDSDRAVYTHLFYQFSRSRTHRDRPNRKKEGKNQARVSEEEEEEEGGVAISLSRPAVFSKECMRQDKSREREREREIADR